MKFFDFANFRTNFLHKVRQVSKKVQMLWFNARNGKFLNRVVSEAVRQSQLKFQRRQQQMVLVVNFRHANFAQMLQLVFKFFARKLRIFAVKVGNVVVTNLADFAHLVRIKIVNFRGNVDDVAAGD